MKNEQTSPKAIETFETASEQEMLGGLSIRTDLRAGISIEDIQAQVSSWWDSLSSSLSLPGVDASSGE